MSVGAGVRMLRKIYFIVEAIDRSQAARVIVYEHYTNILEDRLEATKLALELIALLKKESIRFRSQNVLFLYPLTFKTWRKK